MEGQRTEESSENEANLRQVYTITRMPPSSKHSSIEREKFICFQCKGDVCGKTFEINQQSAERKVITEELEDLQRDVVELNQVLSSINRCSVKEVILSEINLISAKTDILKDLRVANTDNSMPW
jgi:hypothetical protein